jgi:hypothetical protein
MDQKDAYEQIRIVSEHVSRSAMTTPDGNVESLVMQIGDCNAPSTYQALMNHLFSSYIRVFMDVYLDDIIVYSDSLEDHVKHCKLIFDILHEQRLYLSEKKMQLLPRRLKILGRIIDDDGIWMDPDKVDSVLSWKVPTSKELLQGFLGSVGYLADDIAGVRVPMGILHGICGANTHFRWTETHQRAFEQIKEYTAKFCEHHRVPLNYKKDSPPINVVTDASSTGIASVVSQGDNWKTAKVAAFFSAKLNPAQQNYPVHELEMFAGVETMKRHCDILHGAKFCWFTDHKSLVHLLEQKNLSGRQARWLEAISEFDFEVIYVEGSGNILADALSRLYSNDAPGTVRNSSEYSMFDEDHPPDDIVNHGITMPLAVGLEANAVSTWSRTGAQPTWVQKPKQTYQRRPKTLDAPDLTAPSPDLVIPFSGDGMKGGEGDTTSSKDVTPPTTVNLAQSLQHESEETTTPKALFGNARHLGP